MIAIAVHDAASNAEIGVISESDAHFLRQRLESDSADAVTYFIDQATVDVLKQARASLTLLGVLNAAIADAGERVITLVHPADATQDDAEAEAALEVEAVNARIVPVATAREVSARERDLKCVVCGHTHFTHRKAQLHTALATFFDMEWLGATADCYVCDECGYIHWFLR